MAAQTLLPLAEPPRATHRRRAAAIGNDGLTDLERRRLADRYAAVIARGPSEQERADIAAWLAVKRGQAQVG